MRPESAWLLNAPPWAAPKPVGVSAPTTVTNTGKWKASEMSGAEQSLCKLTQYYARRLQRDRWRQTVMAVKRSSNVPEAVGSIPHKAARLLRHLGKRGASVPLATASWNRDKRKTAVHRGPHKSLQREQREFLAAEMLDFCMQGY